MSHCEISQFGWRLLNRNNNKPQKKDSVSTGGKEIQTQSNKYIQNIERLQYNVKAWYVFYSSLTDYFSFDASLWQWRSAGEPGLTASLFLCSGWHRHRQSGLEGDLFMDLGSGLSLWKFFDSLIHSSQLTTKAQVPTNTRSHHQPVGGAGDLMLICLQRMVAQGLRA